MIGCGGLGAFGLAGRRWSPDGHRLYYTRARDGSPDGLACGCCPELTAWDARDGSTAVGYVLSPLEGQVARTVSGPDDGTVLEVADTNLASVRRLPLPVDSPAVGYPTWSPDETWVAFQVGCGDAPSGALAIRLGDGQVLQWDTPDPEQPVIDIAWEPDGKALRIGSFNTAWRWDLATDTVEPAATP
jgi:Tol biopolymer transport system component